jgi:hypothetical protein
MVSFMIFTASVRIILDTFSYRLSVLLDCIPFIASTWFDVSCPGETFRYFFNVENYPVFTDRKLFPTPCHYISMHFSAINVSVFCPCQCATLFITVFW